MRSQHAGRIVRQRKLNRNTPQQVLREDEIESSEYESLQGQYKVETGVEKSEESVSLPLDFEALIVICVT